MPDPLAGAAVSRSFALGWQMSELFVSPYGSALEPTIEEDLPGLSALPSRDLVELGLDQVDAGVGDLQAHLAGSTVELPTTDDVRRLLSAHPLDRSGIRHSILDLHVALLTKLTAADFRCGKAYGLGRALADTCASAQSAGDLAHHLSPDRAGQIVGWLDDLTSVLPAHSAQAVSDSFASWVTWAGDHPFGAMTPADVSATSRTLHAQGQRWRALLSAEKQATDTLVLEDYVTIAGGALRRTSGLGSQLARRLWLPLLVAAVLLVLGLVLIFVFSGAARVVAGLGAVALSLGITWRSTGELLTRLAERVQEPIWGAQCDEVIAARITVRPALSAPAPPETVAFEAGAGVPADVGRGKRQGRVMRSSSTAGSSARGASASSPAQGARGRRSAPPAGAAPQATGPGPGPAPAATPANSGAQSRHEPERIVGPVLPDDDATLEQWLSYGPPDDTTTEMRVAETGTEDRPPGKRD